MNRNFAVVGAAGYIAPRHLRAIQDTGNCVVAALDPHDSVGILDQYALDVHFFTESERFNHHLQMRRYGPPEDRVHVVSICSPNDLHEMHCLDALRAGADAICEKPLVLDPRRLDILQEVEAETGGTINTVLQFRFHPHLAALKQALLGASRDHRYDVRLEVVSARGRWYHTSWKGSEEKSGGIGTNIGIHSFDVLLWLFGQVVEQRVYHRDAERVAGFIEMERARVRWFVSINASDLPYPRGVHRPVFRSITVDGQVVDFTDSPADLHTHVYKEALAGRGCGIDDVRPATELVYAIRNAPLAPFDDSVHEWLTR